MVRVQFDKVYFLLGNHDARMLKRLDYMIKYADLMNIVVQDEQERVVVSQYPKAQVVQAGQEWLVIHPKCYSRVAGQKAKRITEKEHCHVVSTHGHMTALTFDISGKYHAVDIGGNVDYSKVEYVNQQITDHPKWVNSFVVLEKGLPRLFTEKMCPIGRI